MLSRRQVLSGMSLCAAALVTAGCRGTPPAGDAVTPLLRGADLSFTLQEEARGATFADRGRTGPVEHLLADRGANVVRLRVWVDALAGHSDLGSALVLARRARAAGQQLLLDLHYSDTWADKANQATPAAWAGRDLASLAETVRAYTRECLQAFAAQGTPVDLIQIGNEVTSGMLWPAGQVYRDGREHWADFVTLLQAGLRGAHEGGSAALRTVIHIDRGGDNGGARYFYDHILNRDVDFDVLALSYYPFWHGPLAALQSNLDDLTAGTTRTSSSSRPPTLGSSRRATRRATSSAAPSSCRNRNASPRRPRARRPTSRRCAPCSSRCPGAAASATSLGNPPGCPAPAGTAATATHTAT